MDNILTTDLSEFGLRELSVASEILKELSKDKLPEDFYNDGITLNYNRNSSNVFLSNSDCQIAMINESTGNLESFYFMSYAGYEGFYSDLVEICSDDWHIEDLYQLFELATDRDDQENINYITNIIKGLQHD